MCHPVFNMQVQEEEKGTPNQYKFIRLFLSSIYIYAYV